MDMVEKVLRNWNHIEMSINGEIITTSGFEEVFLEVLRGPIGVGMVEKVTMIWNEVKMLFRGEFVTISGFSEVILEVLLVCAWSKKCLGFEIT